MNKLYPTDLTDTQWNTIVQFLDDNRKRKYSLRVILNAIFYLNKTGCHWRMLPRDLPSWKLVYYYFCKWNADGTREEIHEALRTIVRSKCRREKSPSLAIIDSQSVKMSRQANVEKGIDGGKNVKGRKRHIIVDSMGLILAIVVHAANEHDSKAAFRIIQTLKYRFPRLVKIVADAGYRGQLAENVKSSLGWIVQIVMRKDAHKFQILPQRWIVERTFSWFESYRRLAKDFEQLPKNSEAMIRIASIKIMLNKI